MIHYHIFFANVTTQAFLAHVNVSIIVCVFEEHISPAVSYILNVPQDVFITVEIEFANFQQNCCCKVSISPTSSCPLDVRVYVIWWPLVNYATNIRGVSTIPKATLAHTILSGEDVQPND